MTTYFVNAVVLDMWMAGATETHYSQISLPPPPKSEQINKFRGNIDVGFCMTCFAKNEF